MNIEYAITHAERIDIVAPLWRKLNEHHGRISRNFACDYSDRTWKSRKKEFLVEAADLRIDLAKDVDVGKLVGYCMSSIKRDGLGEIDSIFVESDYRRNGIGDKLIRNALDWMASLSVKRMTVQVMVGNEEVHPFYKKHGFLARTTIMMRIDENGTFRS